MTGNGEQNPVERRYKAEDRFQKAKGMAHGAEGENFEIQFIEVY
jgi:hypothetical protein